MAGLATIADYDGSTPLGNVMQELFVISLLEGMTQRQAYRLAGYDCAETSLDSKASQLVSNSKVRLRIDWKRAQLSVKLDISQESLAKEAEEHRQIALRKQDISGANGALSLKAKITGHLTDRLKIEHNVSLADIAARVGSRRRIEHTESKENTDG